MGVGVSTSVSLLLCVNVDVPLILLPDISVEVVFGCISGPKHVLVTDTALKTDAQTYRGLM